jgi:hypothetical protein
VNHPVSLRPFTVPEMIRVAHYFGGIRHIVIETSDAAVNDAQA